jgi:hypothetical protein
MDPCARAKRAVRSAGTLALAAALAVTSGAGCAADVGDAPPVADTVVEAPGATGTGTGDPDRAVNGVRGGGDAAGSTDVYSLGLQAGVDDRIVLRWSGRVVRNGPGADLAVFENPFRVGGGGAVFMDPVVVAVSRDGASWVEFPHRYAAADPRAYQADPSLWEGFAGVTPVRWNVDSNPVDPFDAGAAGGDAFDLSDLREDGGEGSAIRAGGFTFLRLQAAATAVDPATGEPYPRDAASNGPDIDGVAARYLEAAEPGI